MNESKEKTMTDFRDAAKLEILRKRLRWLFILAFVITAGIVPLFFFLNARITAIDPQYVKLQSAAPSSERLLTLNIERDIPRAETLDHLPEARRFLQYDCGQAALDAGGITTFRDEKPDSYRDFQNAVAFREQWQSYVNYVVNSQQRVSVEVLRGQVRSLAEKFLRVVSDPDTEPQSFNDNYQAVLRERARQIDVLKASGAQDKLKPGEEERRSAEPDPSWCNPPPGASIINAEEVHRLVKHTRSVHGFVSALFDFTGGGSEVDIWIWRLAKGIPELEKDINVNASLGNALYLGGRDFDEIFAAKNVAMDSVVSYAETVRNFDPQKSRDVATDSQIREQLMKRYDRARSDFRIELAYLWAEKGLSSREAVWPGEEVVPWPRAQKYAEEEYQAFSDKNRSPPRFRCIDDDAELRVKDTYALVKLAFQAYNVRTKGIFPDRKQVNDARTILEDLRNKLLEMHRIIRTSRPDEQPSLCLSRSGVDAWMKRISKHVSLAEAMR